LLAITIGVASATGILTLNRSTYRSFARDVASIAGNAQIEIANGGVGVPDSLLPAIRSTPGVRAAVGVIQEFVRIPALEDRRVCLIGVDLIGDSRVWEGLFDLDSFDIPDEMALSDDPKGLLLSATLARQGGYAIGDSIAVTAPNGLVSFTLRGAFSDQRFATVFQGDVGLMDVTRAQALFSKRNVFDWIQVVADPNADLAAVRAELERVVDGRAHVTTPAARGERVEAILRTNRWMLTVSSLFAAAVGLFLVAHGMYTSTEQRAPAYATLRTLGASRGQLSALVLTEATTLAVVGSVLGVAAGVAFCKLALGPFGVFVSTTYAQVKPSDLVVAAPDLIAALAIGIGATLLGALLPARQVRAVRPVNTVGQALAPSPRASKSTTLAGVVVCGLGLALPSLRLPREWFAVQTAQAFMAFVIVMFGAALLAPLIVRASGFFVRPALGLGLGSVGRWLWGRFLAGGQRTTMTIAALAAGFAFATMISVFIGSYRNAVIHYLETSFPADVILNVGRPMSMLGGPVASVDLIPEVLALPGVRAVSPLRFLEGTIDGKSIVVQGISDDLLRHRFDESELDMARGEVVISDTLMERYDLHEGSELTLDSPTGPVRLEVRIVEADYFLDLGSVKVPWSVFAERWQETKANVFLVHLEDGVQPSALKSAIDARIGKRYDLTVLTRNDTRQAINLLIDSTFALMFLCEALAVLVAIIAVMNGVACSLLDRTPQLETLRAVGLAPSGLRRLVVIEGSLIGFLGGAIGIVFGAIATYRLLTASLRVVAGFHLPVVWPLGTLSVGLVAACASGAVAACLALRSTTLNVPARRT
jgi:putative ABC transport system permease protein